MKLIILNSSTRQLLILFWIGCSSVLNAQLVSQSSAFFVNTGAVLQINGDFINQDVVQNKGNIIVAGDFSNNGNISGTGYFDLFENWVNNGDAETDSLTVTLNGNNQSIKGSTETVFFNLMLEGSGIKSLEKNIFVSNLLSLADKQLFTDYHRVSLLNSSSVVLTRTSGYVKSTFGGGLIRKCSSTGTFLFPLGNEIIYKPIEITSGGGEEIVFAGMYGENPDLHNYDTENKEDDLEVLNDSYYFALKKHSGSNPGNAKFVFDSITDGNFNALANWNEAQFIWEKVEGTVKAANNIVWQNFSTDMDTIFTLSIYQKSEVDIIEFNIYNTFTPNIDGYNDYFFIEGLENLPGNSIKVYNRNGHLVFEADDYENNWDGKYYGNELPAATYYYIFNPGNGSEEIKGDVTIVR